jgi:hypothetical protein
MQYKIPSATALVLAGLLMAQTTGTTYNLGTPTIPGTRTPEQSPATTIWVPPAGPPATAAPIASGEAAGPPLSPGLSFGAAPPPVVSPNR